MDNLITILMGDDELGAVIRSHLLIESKIIHLINLLIPHPKYLENLRLGYRQRVDLALALGLKKVYGPPLRKFGSIRNQFAHQPKTQLTTKTIDHFFGTFDKEDQQIIIRSFERTMMTSGASATKSFGELEPKDRFIMITVTLHAILTTAAVEIEENQDSL